MSYYDTENLMQTKGNGYLQKALVDVMLLEEFVENAIEELYKLEPSHCNSAYYHCVVKRNNSTTNRADKFLGVDNILEYETEEGRTIYVAIDWTDDPIKVEAKSKRMGKRKPAYDKLGVDLCLAICVDNQVLLRGTKQEQKFITHAYGEIFDKIELMLAKGQYNAALTINMRSIMSI